MSFKVMFFGVHDYEMEALDPIVKDFGLNAKFISDALKPDNAVFAFGCDAVSIFGTDVCGKDVIDEFVDAGVQILALRGAGFNNVDIKYAKGKIHVVRVPAYSPHAIAEFAMGLLLAVNRNIHKSYLRTRDYNFYLGGLVGFDLYGKTVGVIGEGNIGVCFINICKGFGMKVLVNTNHPKGDSGVEYVSKEELYKRSDVISLHCPLTEENHHMINKDTIELMKKNVVIVNTARGALIDTAALIDAIKRKRIKAACIDVYENEKDIFFSDYSNKIMPDDTLSRLIGFPNVLVTSHQAFFTEEAVDGIARTTVSNIVEFFNTGKCKNEIII